MQQKCVPFWTRVFTSITWIASQDPSCKRPRRPSPASDPSASSITTTFRYSSCNISWFGTRQRQVKQDDCVSSFERREGESEHRISSLHCPCLLGAIFEESAKEERTFLDQNTGSKTFPIFRFPCVHRWDSTLIVPAKSTPFQFQVQMVGFTSTLQGSPPCLEATGVQSSSWYKQYHHPARLNQYCYTSLAENKGLFDKQAPSQSDIENHSP